MNALRKVNSVRLAENTYSIVDVSSLTLAVSSVTKSKARRLIQKQLPRCTVYIGNCAVNVE